MTNLCFDLFSKHYLGYPENGFNFVTPSIAKEGKMSFPNSWNISFSSKSGFKTIFEGGPYEELLI